MSVEQIAEVLELADRHVSEACVLTCGFKSHLPHQFFYYRSNLKNKKSKHHTPFEKTKDVGCFLLTWQAYCGNIFL
jgi:hypothetical protein